MKYLFILLLISCNTKKQIIITNDYKILNTIIKNDIHIKNDEVKIIHINNSTFFQKPEFYLKLYQRYYNTFKISNTELEINGKVEWVFTKSDIDYMLNTYKEWGNSKWDSDNIPSDITLFKDNKLPKTHKGQIHRISQPIYDETKSKAIVIVQSHKGWRDIFSKVFILKKNNDSRWIIVGKLFAASY